MTRIAMVLRSGGEYKSEHVTRLADQVRRHARGTPMVCLSDMPLKDIERIPLRTNWPGWWSKLEIMRPDVVGDGLLYMDLDTTLVGDIGPLLERRELTVLSDFYWPDKIQSSLMYVTPDAAAQAWAAFTADPDKHMRECRTCERWGDQGFLEGVWGRDVARWQDFRPGAVVSYKCHVRKAQGRRESGKGRVPEGARVIVHHGRPRPWEVQ